MLIEQSVKRICDQGTGQEDDQNSQCHQDTQNRLDRIGKRMLMCFCKAHPDDRIAILLDLILQHGSHIANMGNVIAALGNCNDSTVEKLRLSQIWQSILGDITGW